MKTNKILFFETLQMIVLSVQESGELIIIFVRFKSGGVLMKLDSFPLIFRLSYISLVAPVAHVQRCTKISKIDMKFIITFRWVNSSY